MYDDYNEIITVQELADLLRIGLNVAYRLVNTGEIDSFKIGNSYRIQRDAVSDYIVSKSRRKSEQVQRC